MPCLWHVLCRGYGMFYAVFVACFVALIERIFCGLNCVCVIT